VAKPKVAQELQLVSYTEDMRHHGLHPETRILDIGYEAADERLAARELELRAPFAEAAQDEPGAAADLEDASVAGDRPIEQAGEGAPFRTLAQPKQAVTWRIAGERRAIVERSDDLAAGIARQIQPGNSVRRGERRAAGAARPVRGEAAAARRTGEQFAEPLHIRRSRR
jgi:hypothetical protein